MKNNKIENAKREFKDKGFYLIEDTYLGTTKKATCVDEVGYKYVIALNKLRQDRAPSRFGNGNPYTIDNIKLWLKLNNKEIELLSDTYISAKSKLRWQCKNNKIHIFESTWDCIRNTTQGCGLCSGKTKYNTDIFKDKVKEILPDIEVIGEYEDIYSDIKCKCLIHNEIFVTTARYLLKGHGCKTCSNLTVYTIDTFKEKLSSINKDVEVLDDKYINNSTPLKCKCRRHNVTWHPTPANLFRGSGCMECWREKVSKENNYRWIGGTTPLHPYLRNKIGEWKRQTMISCDYKCDITGERFDDIHHLYGFDQILEEIFENTGIELKETISEYSESNLKVLEEECIKLHEKYGLGVCLCREMHEEFHKIYGYGNNTPEQYYEFKNNKLNNKNSEEVA